MLIGYMRVSKTDVSQTTDLQRNALAVAISEKRLGFLTLPGKLIAIHTKTTSMLP